MRPVALHGTYLRGRGDQGSMGLVVDWGVDYCLSPWKAARVLDLWRTLIDSTMRTAMQGLRGALTRVSMRTSAMHVCGDKCVYRVYWVNELGLSVARV